MDRVQKGEGGGGRGGGGSEGTHTRTGTHSRIQHTSEKAAASMAALRRRRSAAETTGPAAGGAEPASEALKPPLWLTNSHSNNSSVPRRILVEYRWTAQKTGCRSSFFDHPRMPSIRPIAFPSWRYRNKHAAARTHRIRQDHRVGGSTFSRQATLAQRFASAASQNAATRRRLNVR